MAGRIRSIKPELLEDEHAAALSHVAWRLWVSSFLLADDFGNFRAAPVWLAGQAFWGRPESPEVVAKALDELATCKGDGAGLIEMYTVGGQRYAHLTGWRHQKVDKVGKPRCPGPDAAGAQKYESLGNSLRPREEVANAEREPRESGANDPLPARAVDAPDLDLRPPTGTSDQEQYRSQKRGGVPPIPLNGKTEDDPPSSWTHGQAIRTTRDFQRAASVFRWNDQQVYQHLGVVRRILAGGKIETHEIERFQAKSTSKNDPVAYFLGAIEKDRKRQEEEE